MSHLAKPCSLIAALFCLLVCAPAQAVQPANAYVEAALGKGVRVEAADGSMSMQIRARAQLRGVFIYDQDEDDDPASEEFLIRRARLQLKGHALTRALTYYIQLGFSNSDTESDLRLPLRDAQINWEVARDLQIKAGQMKVPFNRQRTTSSSALQILERSLSNSELNLDRDVGVQLHSDDLFGVGERLGYEIGVFGGEGRNRTWHRSGMLYAGRLNITPLGPLLGDEEADLDNSPLRVAVGLIGAYNANTRRARSTHSAVFTAGDVDYLHAGADVALRWRGLSINAEALMRQADEDTLVLEREDGSQVEEQTRSAMGYLVQGGYMFTDSLELTGRFSLVDALGESAVEQEWEAGGGVSWYISEHALKLQTDYLRLDGPAIHGAHQVRLQLQFFL